MNAELVKEEKNETTNKKKSQKRKFTICVQDTSF